jgi:hypothetical protein
MLIRLPGDVGKAMQDRWAVSRSLKRRPWFSQVGQRTPIRVVDSGSFTSAGGAGGGAVVGALDALTLCCSRNESRPSAE